jgi:NAD(P)-dependent dehydrogenase (short-subunit alcohol dehydrogenase family)
MRFQPKTLIGGLFVLLAGLAGSALAQETIDMQGKTALVTGSTSGLGATVAARLGAMGATVIVHGRSAERGQEVVDAINAAGPGKAIFYQADLGSLAEVKALADRVKDEHGALHLLINNAGIGGATPLELTPEAEHRQMFETNYFGAVRCIQAVLPGMRERRAGAIVNITSITGIIATPNQIPYSASKWALECLGEALAHELFRFGVRVVNVEPGVVMTSIFENSEATTRYDKTSPYQPLMRRNGKMFAAGFRDPAQPADVAETILTAITTPDYRLRWPVGKDAVGMAAGRPRLRDEEWIAMGADLSDQEYNDWFLEHFGIKL